MLYDAVRAIARLALRWFYRDIEVEGADRLPIGGPILIASNHPNALVDALIIIAVLPARATLTAKATLFDHVFTRLLLSAVGVVPLRRASDETRTNAAAPVEPLRNERSFDALLDKLALGGVVLVFPEGKSHSASELAPLRTGLARIALRTIHERQLSSLPILPIGLTFERKATPGSRVLVRVGEPLRVTRALSYDPVSVTSLTADIDKALRAVTLNFPSLDAAQRLLPVSSLLAGVFDVTPDDLRPLGAPDTPFAETIALAHRLAVIDRLIPRTRPFLQQGIERFLKRLESYRASLASRRIATNDVGMPLDVGGASWFVVRELSLAVLAGPFALWGRINHWIPLRLARWYAERTSREPDDPAMQTIVGGLALVLVFYAAQVMVALLSLGGWLALMYTVSLPLSGTWDLKYAARVRRVRRRIHTYLVFRRNPQLRTMLIQEAQSLRSEALALNEQLAATPSLHDGSEITTRRGT
jgi:glycerol-3-phosphate O-acyltransferase/dihydroxyacetone phosphate acyltransferase